MTEQEQLEFLHSEIRRLDYELEHQMQINQQLEDIINELFSMISCAESRSHEETLQIRRELRQHTIGFHTMLIAKGDKNESNIP